MFWGKGLAAAATPMLAAGLAGCALVDNFSGRAIDYNLQAEQAQEQQLLLNVVRASQRRPMQFTGLQSITGTASASGNSTLTTPFGEAMHRPKGAVSPDIFSLGGSISGGPTFIVPVLDTQEFYQGILSPISLQVFDYYLQQGFPKEVLFDLFVSKIVVTQKSGNNSEMVFNNAVGDDAAFEQFQAMVDILIAAGLSTEHVETTSAFGPAIAAAKLQPSSSETGGQQAAALLDAYANIANAGLKLAEGNGTDKGTYHLQKSEVKYRFCFTNEGASARNLLSNIGQSLYCNQSGDKSGAQRATAAVTGANDCSSLSEPRGNADNRGSSNAPPVEGSPDSGGNATLCLTLNPATIDALNRRLQSVVEANPEAARSGLAPLSAQNLISEASAFKLQVRSTEGILYYLGEITRRHLYPETTTEARPRIIQVPTRVPLAALPERACDDESNRGKTAKESDLLHLVSVPGLSDSYFCENLFVIDQHSNSGFVSVGYDGSDYSIPSDGARAGRTYQVLELVKQLLAVNTSAKQFPATNVLSIISSP